MREGKGAVRDCGGPGEGRGRGGDGGGRLGSGAGWGGGLGCDMGGKGRPEGGRACWGGQWEGGGGGVDLARKCCGVFCVTEQCRKAICILPPSFTWQ